MIGLIFIPPSIKFTNKCSRCGLLYPKDEAKCTHCDGLTDEELIIFKKKIEAQNEGNKNLGFLFLFFTLILLLLMWVLN